MNDVPRGHLDCRWVEVGGLRMFARVSTDEPRDRSEPIVLVPGLNISSRHMAQLGELLAPYVRVYSPDLPGYGLSDKPRRFLRLSELSDVLADWMSAIGLERAALLGSSFSAQIVADFAVRYPHPVSRVVLAGPTVDPRSRPLPKLIWRWRLNEGREPGHVGEITKRDYRYVSKLRALFTMWQMVADHIEDRLPRIEVPALVVRGSNDPVVSAEWAEQAARLLPRGRLVVIPGGAHALNLDSPVELAQVVRQFLGETAGSDASVPHAGAVPAADRSSRGADVASSQPASSAPAGHTYSPMPDNAGRPPGTAAAAWRQQGGTA